MTATLSAAGARPAALAIAAIAALACGCGGGRVPSPPPAETLPTPPPHQPAATSSSARPPAPLAASSTALAAAISVSANASASATVEDALPSGPMSRQAKSQKTEPKITISMETPYKMGERAEPKTHQEYKKDILDRRHWNSGGMGELLADAPGPEGHPDPRVRVNIEKVRGGHRADKLQRHARKYHWINVVRCYRYAYQDPHLRGWTHARIDISKRGKVRGARLLSTELTVPEVADCMVKRLGKLAFPTARAGTRAWVDMKVSPGDDPIRPPDDLWVAGDGELDVDDMRQGVSAGMRDFEACYRAAFDYAPGLWGRLLIRFHLTDGGRLDEAFEIGSRFPDKRVSQCVLRAARKLKFPRPRGGDIRFQVPLRFTSDRAKTERAGE